MRCNKILLPTVENPGGELAEHDAITIGKEYVVLHICVDPDSGTEFAILDDRPDSRSQWPARMFETVDDRMPSNWVAQYDEDGFLNIAPRLWLVPGFWGPEYLESGYKSPEDRLESGRDYRRERDIIIRESG